MPLQLIARGPLISSAPNAKKLTKDQQAQLSFALKTYFGKKVSLANAFPRDEPTWVQRFEVVDADDPSTVLYDFWEINADSGELFVAGVAKSASIERLQGCFSVVTNADDDGALSELALALSQAERLPDPDAPFLFEPDEIRGSYGMKPIRRIAAFRKPEAMPKTKKEWDQLLTGENIYVTEAFAEQYSAHFTPSNWKIICSYTTLSEDFLRKHHASLGWANIGFSQVLSEPFLREFAEQLVWNGWQGICARQKLSEGFLREQLERIDWTAVAQNQELSVGFIEEFAAKIPLGLLDVTRLPEDFLRKYADQLSWDGTHGSISMRADLSESFVRDFQDRLNWTKVTMYRDNSSEFLDEFAERIEWRHLGHNKHLTDAQIRHYKDKISWLDLIAFGRRLSDDMIREHAAYLDENMWTTLVERKKVSPEYAKEITARLRDEKKRPHKKR